MKTYTVCEDQPKLDRWDVEIKTFTTYEAALRFLLRRYTAAERAGEEEMCRPLIRNDATGEYVG
jgi:hypothetical protein